MDIPATLSYEYGNSLQAGQKLNGHRIMICRHGAEALRLGFANKAVVIYELSNDSSGDLVWALTR